jgi:hypothetical protein
MAMQSQAPSVPKIAAEDTSLTVNNADGGKTTFPVPAGTHVHFHFPAVHYNCTLNLFLSQGLVLIESLTARYWKDPYTFRPERFLEDWPRDAFLPFSSGRFGLVMTPDPAS